MEGKRKLGRPVGSYKVSASYRAQSAKVSCDSGYIIGSRVSDDLDLNHTYAQLMNKDYVPCEYCGAPLPFAKRKAVNKVCNNKCRIALRLQKEAEEKAYWDNAYRAKNQSRIMKGDRKCNTCGKPCYPNYFYCASCHAGKKELY
jgi:hypothetical protein